MLAGITMLSSSTSASAIARPASLKVYYGDMPFWRAEVVRLALFMGDVPFEDVRDQKRVDLIVRAHMLELTSSAQPSRHLLGLTLTSLHFTHAGGRQADVRRGARSRGGW